jgi:hypothetical protein
MQHDSPKPRRVRLAQGIYTQDGALAERLGRFPPSSGPGPD